MSKKIEGEFEVGEEKREAGIGYLDLMRECIAATGHWVTDCDRFMPTRTEWMTRTVLVTVTPL